MLKDKIRDYYFEDNVKNPFDAFSKLLMNSNTEITSIPTEANAWWYNLSIDILKYLIHSVVLVSDLNDNYDTQSRIKCVNQTIGALNFSWILMKFLYTKYIIYVVIPSNLLLFGCESHFMTKDKMEKLEVFHSR